MPSINPFLHSFFRSALLSQCSPSRNHILLVPTSISLLENRDQQTGVAFTELSASDEFLESHVLRFSGKSSFKDVKAREITGKTRQAHTVNGRTVVFRDSFVYSNKGFKTFNQAQILGDAVWYRNGSLDDQWLLLYISSPLVGTPQSLHLSSQPQDKIEETTNESGLLANRKKSIDSFNDLLNEFPMIARQMQSGLDHIFKKARECLTKALPPTPSTIDLLEGGKYTPTIEHGSPFVNGAGSNRQNTSENPTEVAIIGGEHDLRSVLETAVTSAIDLFQQVDKQQLSLLGTTTELTGPAVEKQIDRYVATQLHDALIFPRLCSLYQEDDAQFDAIIRQVGDVDVSQVGAQISGGSNGKRKLMARLTKAVGEFRKLVVARSPQEMIQILLRTEKVISHGPENKDEVRDGVEPAEKYELAMTINADTLVSVLLVVVARSQVRHLQARATYMRNFVFSDDVETGETGYALSTLEAVLSYVGRDSGNLKRISRSNRNLWQAAKKGQLSTLRDLFEQGQTSDLEHALSSDTNEQERSSGPFVPRENDKPGHYDHGIGLSHVFPFQTNGSVDHPSPPTPQQKRVSLDARSMSSSSQVSFRSRSSTFGSMSSQLQSDISVEKLSSTQNASGSSVLMIAVENSQSEVLRYLLSLSDIFPIRKVLDDVNNDDTTLLSAAIQNGCQDAIVTIMRFIREKATRDQVDNYLHHKDSRGRTIGHYLFNAPSLIAELGGLISWTIKDKNGQTPLFALCRSYDHPDYEQMFDQALDAAEDSRRQRSKGPLQLDDHVDRKGNTLLHVVNTPKAAARMIYTCDSNVNALNDKNLTPLMLASKYGRLEMARVFFKDPRVDTLAKDLRGLTAVELAKDEEMRNHIDDLVLLNHPEIAEGKITAIVRGLLVDDGTIRLILKSATPSSDSTVTVTTCRRSLADFETLAKWLSVEHPASWIPTLSNIRTPFQIPFRPSKAVLRDIQARLDGFLNVLLLHPTFSTHEMVWEFVLAPEIQPEMMAERSQKKAEIRLENVQEEFEPIKDPKEVELFARHAQANVRSLNQATAKLAKVVHRNGTAAADLVSVHKLLLESVSRSNQLPRTHENAFRRFTQALSGLTRPPLTALLAEIHTIWSASLAVEKSLGRPIALLNSMSQLDKGMDRHVASLRRSDRWPLGLLDETRSRLHREAVEKIESAESEFRVLGSELRYTQQVTASELAAWQDIHESLVKRAIRKFAAKVVVAEKGKLQNMRTAIRHVLDISPRKKT